MQPYATLLAIGAKSIETRSWKTPYRGLLAVHASQTIKREAATVAGMTIQHGQL